MTDSKIKTFCADCGKDAANLYHGECYDCAYPDHASYDFDDAEHDYEFDCMMMADGICMLAGTEDCDWECPNRDLGFLVRSSNA